MGKITYTASPIPSCCGMTLLTQIYTEGYYELDGKVVPTEVVHRMTREAYPKHLPWKYVPGISRNFSSEEIAEFTKKVTWDHRSTGMLQMNITWVSMDNAAAWAANGWIIGAECQSNHAKYRITSLFLVLREYEDA